MKRALANNNITQVSRSSPMPSNNSTDFKDMKISPFQVHTMKRNAVKCKIRGTFMHSALDRASCKMHNSRTRCLPKVTAASKDTWRAITSCRITHRWPVATWAGGIWRSAVLALSRTCKVSRRLPDCRTMYPRESCWGDSRLRVGITLWLRMHLRWKISGCLNLETTSKT